MASLVWLASFLLLFHFHFQASVSFSLNSNSSAMLCQRDQSLALLQFKETFSIAKAVFVPPYYPKPYLKTKYWKEGTDCCWWDGITCDMETGNVIGLHLSNSFLYGPIYSNNPLFSLRHLRKLDLSLNDFNHSRIVPQFGQFSKLTHLNLSYSGFVGQIPSEITYLSGLLSLDLSWNYDLISETTIFTKLVQNLTQLRELDLSEVNMSVVAPSSLMNLSSSLTSLKLEFCEMQGKIPDISRLSKLVSLDLSWNFGGLTIEPMIFDKLDRNLTKIRDLAFGDVNMSMVEPSSLMNISSYLSSLGLRYCELKGKFPDNIIQRSNLQLLDLLGNEDLNGSLPRHNWNNSLRSLSLSLTQITIYLDHDFISNLKSLETLELCQCNFRVSNLKFLGMLTRLITLDISFNNFSGQIPSSLGSLKQLSYLYLSDNNFSGEIPSSFKNLKQLQELWLQNNHCSGPIPHYFTNFTLLYVLYLSNNKFTGPIPFQVGGFSSLISLYLSNNLLNATIPPSVFILPQLRYLLLDNNQLTGRLGPFQENPLVHIDLSNNKLYGFIPSSIFKLVDLNVLILSSNKLIGEVSSAVCNLNSLKILDLSNNSLNGFIPQCLGNFSNDLSVLHLGTNNFQGTIPETFSARGSLRYLNFNGNQLQRRIPLSISNCRNLEILDLGNNNIDDSFPHFLETLPELQILILKSNKLHGFVKGSSTNYSFSKLRMFDLSDNMLSGPLPSGYFNNFKAMMNFDVKMEYMRTPNFSYDYSVRLTLKGVEIELVRIQTLLTTIDLSGNKFTGEIPQSIGKLKALKLLNFSHNQLTGNIQPSLRESSNLESLDLSSNFLVGRIPMQLTDLTFLQVFRVSDNRLEGPIPEGKQFNTFDKSSYEGNLGLCGFPLEKCNNGERQKPEISKEDDSNSKFGFGWQPVVAGYGCGVIFGIAMGYRVFKTRKPIWFVRIVEGQRRAKPKRFKN
ncbi:receptor-like protein Cf-9 homolog isoform X2 [Manihot esculenta]|uniref:receptor-like protein Cf-9 homolog isoform X2 n=1 Tax=Manihot esculenta TaxID=3983 RepID=UPI001CC562F3|nr:receptor-like protein Cf-9 homolog isoform X2 [Manihot esculenta]